MFSYSILCIHTCINLLIYRSIPKLLFFVFGVLGEELGQPKYAVPFLAPNATGKAILHGVNYASGGGGILNATGRIFVSIS